MAPLARAGTDTFGIQHSAFRIDRIHP